MPVTPAALGTTDAGTDISSLFAAVGGNSPQPAPTGKDFLGLIALLLSPNQDVAASETNTAKTDLELIPYDSDAAAASWTALQVSAPLARPSHNIFSNTAVPQVESGKRKPDATETPTVAQSLEILGLRQNPTANQVVLPVPVSDAKPSAENPVITDAPVAADAPDRQGAPESSCPPRWRGRLLRLHSLRTR